MDKHELNKIRPGIQCENPQPEQIEEPILSPAEKEELEFMQDFHPGVQISKQNYKSGVDMDKPEKNIKSKEEIDRKYQGTRIRRIK